MNIIKINTEKTKYPLLQVYVKNIVIYSLLNTLTAAVDFPNGKTRVSKCIYMEVKVLIMYRLHL